MGARKTHCKNGHPRVSENLFANNSCKQCSKIATRNWQQTHPEKVKQYNDDHQRRKKAKPEGVREYWLKSRYGVTLEKYHSMLIAQENKCAICGCLMTSPKLDHDHATKKPRQLLCNNCNCGLGFFQDDTKVLEEAIAYLKKWRPLCRR